MNRRKAIWLGFVALVVIAAVSVKGLRAQTREADQWNKLKFLEGTWSGSGSGSPSENISGSTTFSFDLDKQILVRKNRAELAKKSGDKAPAVHEDLMIVYRESGNANPRAIYFDSEGHVIHYAVSFPTNRTAAVFESDGNDKTPRFRITHSLVPDGRMEVEFSIAPPGGEFKSYVKGTVKKQR